MPATGLAAAVNELTVRFGPREPGMRVPAPSLQDAALRRLHRSGEAAGVADPPSSPSPPSSLAELAAAADTASAHAAARVGRHLEVYGILVTIENC